MLISLVIKRQSFLLERGPYQLEREVKLLEK